MTYPDYRYHEEELYHDFKSRDYRNETDYHVLFSDHVSYLRAIKDEQHPFHTEALQIRNNRYRSMEPDRYTIEYAKRQEYYRSSGLSEQNIDGYGTSQ